MRAPQSLRITATDASFRPKSVPVRFVPGLPQAGTIAIRSEVPS